MFIQNEQGEILNISTLQIAVRDAVHQAMPELGLEFFQSPSSGEPHGNQRLGLTEVRLDGSVQRFHTMLRGHSQFHDMGVLLSQLSDSHGSYPPLLILPHMPLKQALQCKKAGLNFLDAAGNMFLRTASSLVFIVGMPRLQVREAGSSFKALATATGLRTLFNLLISPDLVNAPYREISEASQVSLGSVGNLMDSLAQHGFIEVKTRGPRRLVQSTELMDLWASSYPLALRGKLNACRFSASRDIPYLDKLPPGAYWGGEAAADRMIRYMQPKAFTIYCESPFEVIQQLRLRADPRGAVEILDTFWPSDRAQTDECVHPLLVYADLAASSDPRSLETAGLIRSRFLEH